MSRIKITAFTAVILLLLTFSSCDEGIFNFNDQTGNLALSFEKSTTYSIDIGSVVFILENQDSGDYLRKEYDYDGSIDDYISRINTGSWQLTITVYDSSGTQIFQNSDGPFSFDLELAETANVDLILNYDGTNYWIEADIDVGDGTEDPVIGISAMDVLVVGIHAAGDDSRDSINFTCSVMVKGYGFTSGLAGLYIQYPDGSSFSSGDASRAISGLSISTDASYMTISRKGFYSKGDYYIRLIDVYGNVVEQTFNLYFDLDPYNGTAIFTSSYGEANPITTSGYDSGDATGVGSYIAYCVLQGTGTMVQGSSLTIVENPDGVSSIALPGIGSPSYDYVLVTTDYTVPLSDLSAIYIPGTTDMSVGLVPEWLYTYYGSSIHYIGISVYSN